MIFATRLVPLWMLALVFALPSPCAAVIVLDANYTVPQPGPSWGIAVHHEDGTYSQSFTVEHTGLLSRLEVQVWRDNPEPSQPLIVELWGGQPLATFSFDAAIVPTEMFTTTMTGDELGAQAFGVTAGQTLTIVLKSDTPGFVPANVYYWQSYQSSGENHFGFRAFVDVPEPSSFALTALGAVGLATWGWRRRVFRDV